MQDPILPYDVHPSERLVQLFSQKPYQGAEPSDAKVLIIGNDANYSPEITAHGFFNRILEYHEDGVKFWQATGFHHPFVLPEYPFDKRKGGVPYHSNFRKLKFSSADADRFSFVELLNVPTIGNTGANKELFFRLLDAGHLGWLEELIFGGERKFVLVNQTLAKSIALIRKRTGQLGRLAEAIAMKPAPAVAYETTQVTIYNGYSFSASISNDYLERLGRTIRGFVDSV
jgi:hypothetical protein